MRKGIPQSRLVLPIRSNFKILLDLRQAKWPSINMSFLLSWAEHKFLCVCPFLFPGRWCSLLNSRLTLPPRNWNFKSRPDVGQPRRNIQHSRICIGFAAHTDLCWCMHCEWDLLLFFLVCLFWGESLLIKFFVHGSRGVWAILIFSLSSSPDYDYFARPPTGRERGA